MRADADGATIAELAWVVGTAYQGRGLAGEAARAVRDAVLAAGATTVVAHIAPGHIASESVARGVGLVRTDQVHEGETRWELPAPTTVRE